MKDKENNEIYKNDFVKISNNAVKRFNLSNNTGTVTEAKHNAEQLVAVIITGDDAPTDLHAKSLAVIPASELEQEEPQEPQEPQQGDYITQDHRNFYQDHKLTLSITEEDDMKSKLQEHMKENNFFPNVWFLSDHGNYHPITL